MTPRERIEAAGDAVYSPTHPITESESIAAAREALAIAFERIDALEPRVNDTGFYDGSVGAMFVIERLRDELQSPAPAAGHRPTPEERPMEEKADGAGLICQPIPDMAGTLPRPSKTGWVLDHVPNCASRRGADYCDCDEAEPAPRPFDGTITTAECRKLAESFEADRLNSKGRP